MPSGGPWAEKWSDFTLPEAPWEGPGEPPGRHFGIIFAARPAGTKKVRKNSICLYMFDVVFILCCMFLLRLPGDAGASAYLEKHVVAWKVLQISLVGRFRAERTNKKNQEKPSEKTT